MAASLRQSASTTSGRSTGYYQNRTISFPNPVVQGSLLVLTLTVGATYGVGGVTDSLGNTWQRAGGDTNTVNVDTEIWYCANCIGGLPVINSTHGNYVPWSMEVHEITGMATSAPLDKFAVLVETDYFAVKNGPSVTTTIAGDQVAIAVLGNTYDAPTAADEMAYAGTNGFSFIKAAQGAPYLNSASFIKMLSGPQTVTPGVNTGSNATKGVFAVATFKVGVLTLPGVPGNVRGTPGDSKASISFDDAAQATDYNLYKSQIPGQLGNLYNASNDWPTPAGWTEKIRETFQGNLNDWVIYDYPGVDKDQTFARWLGSQCAIGLAPDGVTKELQITGQRVGGQVRGGGLLWKRPEAISRGGRWEYRIAFDNGHYSGVGQLWVDDEQTYCCWPQYNEFDITEWGGVGRAGAQYNNHYSPTADANDHDIYATPTSVDFTTYHDIAFEWEPGVYTAAWCDGVKYADSRDGTGLQYAWNGTRINSPANKAVPMHLVFQMDFPYSDITQYETNPVKMRVQRCRFLQKAS